MSSDLVEIADILPGDIFEMLVVEEEHVIEGFASQTVDGTWSSGHLAASVPGQLVAGAGRRAQGLEAGVYVDWGPGSARYYAHVEKRPKASDPIDQLMGKLA